MHEYISTNLADKLMRFVLFTPLVILVVLVVPDITLVITPLNIALFIVALTLAWFIRFIIQFTLGLLSFWFSQALVLTDVFWLFFLLFGGTVAPIELLPEPLRTIAYILPFRLMMSFPINIMMGTLTPAEIVINFVELVAWIAVFFILYQTSVGARDVSI